jgi:type I restriction enzyme R subunit
MIEKMPKQMLKRSTIRSDFIEHFKAIINAYNTGGSQSDNFYEKLLKFMEELREEELEIYDLLRKNKLTFCLRFRCGEE